MKQNRKVSDYDLAEIILCRANIKLAIDIAQKQIYAELGKLQRLYQDIAESNCSEDEEAEDDVPVFDVLHINEKGEVIGYEERVPDEDEDEDEGEEDEN